MDLEYRAKCKPGQPIHWKQEYAWRPSVYKVFDTPFRAHMLGKRQIPVGYILSGLSSHCWSQGSVVARLQTLLCHTQGNTLRRVSMQRKWMKGELEDVRIVCQGTRGGEAIQFGAARDKQTAMDTNQLSGHVSTGAATFSFISVSLKCWSQA